MRNVFVYCFSNNYLFACLVACLYVGECIWWISLFNFSSMCCLLFFISVFFKSFISSIYNISDKSMFSVFLSSSVFSFLVILFLFIYLFISLSQCVSFSFRDSFSSSFSFTLYHCQSLHDIAWFDMIYCILWYCMWEYDIVHDSVILQSVLLIIMSNIVFSSIIIFSSEWLHSPHAGCL